MFTSQLISCFSKRRGIQREVLNSEPLGPLSGKLFRNILFPRLIPDFPVNMINPYAIRSACNPMFHPEKRNAAGQPVQSDGGHPIRNERSVKTCLYVIVSPDGNNFTFTCGLECACSSH